MHGITAGDGSRRGVEIRDGRDAGGGPDTLILHAVGVHFALGNNPEDITKGTCTAGSPHGSVEGNTSATVDLLSDGRVGNHPGN